MTSHILHSVALIMEGLLTEENRSFTKHLELKDVFKRKQAATEVNLLMKSFDFAKLTFWKLTFWELTFWELCFGVVVDVLGVVFWELTF